MRFRKKPVEIEAVPVAEVLAVNDGPLAPKLPDWVVEALGPQDGSLPYLILNDENDEEVSIHTSKGVMVGNFDDWLIRGVQGELYSCKPDIFEATYEAVEMAVGDNPQQEEG